ncbi:outer membrane lipoprotein carrier protein LolA [Methylobacter sp.]|uniref:LolA family protein n=1 Tax=Methylobacter sp. TaxID=2051955 RepID=UPI00121F2E06|nr:outer membrane lipoprotein carrier protein LolA [Methylobacter sp.]TAK59773.1 MAG: outer membrane lipoprotein carrier protein LolA [Methylobacter sp.]
MFSTALLQDCTGLRYCYIPATFLKTLLLFFLLLGQSYADDVLIQITPRLAKTPITQGDFYQQKYLKALHKPLISSGTFTYHQSKGVIWKTLTPVVSLLLVNESRLLTGQGEQAVPAAFGKVFKAMLGADLAALTDGFSVTGTDQKTSWQLELTPKEEMLKKIISTMMLSGDTELRHLEIREAGGNITRISFDNITHPAKLNDEQQADFERLSP